MTPLRGSPPPPTPSSVRNDLFVLFSTPSSVRNHLCALLSTACSVRNHHCALLSTACSVRMRGVVEGRYSTTALLTPCVFIT